MGLGEGLHPVASPLHLVMIALSPLPPGRTRLTAAVRDGVDYPATIDATPTRRELRFPRALLWADWKVQQFRSRAVFIVQRFDRWPDSRITVRDFSDLDPATATFARIEEIEPE
jgi:hypothetical protein